MHCELVVPGLLTRKAPGRFPSIETLLARGRREPGTETKSLEGWLKDAFQVTANSLPAGALTALAAGEPLDDACWMRADPVHLHLLRDHMVLVPTEALAIPPGEAEALCEALNRHFAGAVVFKAAAPARWLARTGKEVAVPHESPLEAAGRRVAPAGESGPLLTEIQMLLHAHPVNAAREARGEPPINSLWLWGAGRAPAARGGWNSAWSDEPLALGLARLAGARHGPLPATAAAWLERAPEDGRHLAVLDALRAPLVLEDAAAYQENLRRLEQAWFAPLLAALRGSQVGMATVHVPDAGVAVETVRGDLRRFWRRPKALEIAA